MADRLCTNLVVERFGEYIGLMSSITELRDTLIGLQPPPDAGSGRLVVERLDGLRVLRNVLDHQIAVHIALLEDSGAPARAGSTTRSWLIEMGMPPTAAHRGARIAAGLGSLPKVADCAADGYLAAECVDAVVRGIASIDKQAATALSDDDLAAMHAEARVYNRRRRRMGARPEPIHARLGREHGYTHASPRLRGAVARR